MGLGEIKQRIGTEQPNLYKILYEIAEETINNHLDKDDLSILYRDDTYVLLFAHASLEQGKHKAELIAKEIKDKLLDFNNRELEYIEIMQAVSEIKTDMLIDKMLIDFIETNDTSQKFTEEMLIEGTADKPSYSYIPLWDTNKSALTTYLCLSSNAEENENYFESYREMFSKKAVPEMLAMDISILNIVAKELKNIRKDGRKLLIACPVQYETLYQHESYAYYKKKLSEIPADDRQLLLILVMNSTNNLSAKDSYWFVAQLRQLCRDVMAEMPLKHNMNSQYLRPSGVHIGGVCIRKNTALTEQEIIGLLNKFSLNAKSIEISKTFVLGLSSLSLTTSAVCAGFDYLGGDAIHKAVIKPDNIYRYQHADLLAGLAQNQ